MRRILILLGLTLAFATATLLGPVPEAKCAGGVCRGQSCTGICPIGCACVPFRPPYPLGKCV